MAEVLRGLLIAGAVAWAVCALAALWMRHRLRQQLRIVPSERSAAPTAWVVSPSAPARLHRRLRTVAASARLASSIDPGLATVADELACEALALEPHVVASAGGRRACTVVRRDLAARIAELEAVARQLTVLASRATDRTAAGARLRERLLALEAAREELAEIDLRAGLLRHT